MSIVINCDNKVLLPKGYYSTNIDIKLNNLASQTPGTATAADVKIGKTAWVNGSKLNGTFSGVDNGFSLLQKDVIFEYEIFRHSVVTDKDKITDSNIEGKTITCNPNTTKYFIIIINMVREEKRQWVWQPPFPAYPRNYGQKLYMNRYNFASIINIQTLSDSVWDNKFLQADFKITSVKGGNITTSVVLHGITGGQEFVSNAYECYMELWQLK